MYRIGQATLWLWSGIDQAVTKGKWVAFIDRRTGTVVEGVARGVVMPDSLAFAMEWTEDRRLWVTNRAVEVFVRLGDITEFIVRE